jgi:hypothetical protein
MRGVRLWNVCSGDRMSEEDVVDLQADRYAPSNGMRCHERQLVSLLHQVATEDFPMSVLGLWKAQVAALPNCA